MKLFTPRFTKLFSRIILLFSTFFIGLVGYSFWVKMSPPILTPCEVAKNPFQYQGKIIRLSSFVQTNHGIFYFRDKSCNFKGLDAAISLPEDYEPQSEQIRNFISETNEKYLSAQTVITGEIDTTIQFQDYEPNFVIKATKIELTTEVTAKEKYASSESDF